MPDSAGPGMSAEAQHHFDRYSRWLGSDFEKARATALTVLIWGPEAGTAAGLAMKREEVRALLVSRGVLAMYSEQIDPVCSEFTAWARIAELCTERRADLVLALCSSPGSMDAVREGAKALGTTILVKDIADCDLATGAAAALDKLRLAKWLAGRMGIQF